MQLVLALIKIFYHLFSNQGSKSRGKPKLFMDSIHHLSATVTTPRCMTQQRGISARCTHIAGPQSNTQNGEVGGNEATWLSWEPYSFIPPIQLWWGWMAVGWHDSVFHEFWIGDKTLRVLTKTRAGTDGVQGNKIHSSVIWTLRIPKMWLLLKSNVGKILVLKLQGCQVTMV